MTKEDILIIAAIIIFVTICTGFVHMCPICKRWFALYRKNHYGNKGYICKHCKYEHKM